MAWPRSSLRIGAEASRIAQTPLHQRSLSFGGSPAWERLVDVQLLSWLAAVGDARCPLVRACWHKAIENPNRRAACEKRGAQQHRVPLELETKIHSGSTHAAYCRTQEREVSGGVSSTLGPDAEDRPTPARRSYLDLR